MMEKFTFIDYNQFSSFMQNKDFQANNIVFWTGAGIDCDTPTCLPLGAALTEKILSWTCGDMGAELFKKWGEICKAVNSLCWPKEKLHLSSIPRLESILERVRLCEKQSSIDGSNNSVMTMISGFSDAPPNPSHYALAKAISEGASVVTTNYSLCVETAFERLTGKKLSPEKVDNTSVYIYSIPNEAVGRIIHIHGVAFDKESIGISLSSVKNELPSQVVEIIKGWLHESKTFIFAGYSASDVFDVNLLFRHILSFHMILPFINGIYNGYQITFRQVRVNYTFKIAIEPCDTARIHIRVEIMDDPIFCILGNCVRILFKPLCIYIRDLPDLQY